MIKSKLKKARNPFAVVGMSHTQSLYRVCSMPRNNRTKADMKFNARTPVVNLKHPSNQAYFKDDQITPQIKTVLKKSKIISMIGGNFHVIFGLVEQPVPFDFILKGDCDGPLLDDRTIISYELLYAHFEYYLQKTIFSHIERLKDYGYTTVAHISSPPPIADEDHLTKNKLGLVSSKRYKRGITPKSIRMKLFKLQTIIIREYCENNNIQFIPPPDVAVDESGFFNRDFWSEDPTHGNNLYGELIRDDVRKFIKGSL